MTSNMGSSYIQSQMEKLNSSNKEEVVEETKKEVMNMLKKTIRPEFLNRIDETIMFLPLTEKEIREIVLLQIKGVQKMLAGNGVELKLTDAAINFIAQGPVMIRSLVHARKKSYPALFCSMTCRKSYSHKK